MIEEYTVIQVNSTSSEIKSEEISNKPRKQRILKQLTCFLWDFCCK